MHLKNIILSTNYNQRVALQYINIILKIGITIIRFISAH